MKTILRFCLPAILVVFIPIRAQLVSDGATNTLSDITNIIAGGVTVGTNGTSTLLVLGDNCLLTNTGLSQIGLNLYADTVADVFQTVPGAGFPRVAADTEEHFDIVLTNSVSNTRFYRLRFQP